MAWATKYIDVTVTGLSDLKPINDAGGALWEPFAIEERSGELRRVWLKREYWLDQDGNHVDKDNNAMQP